MLNSFPILCAVENSSICSIIPNQYQIITKKQKYYSESGAYRMLICNVFISVMLYNEKYIYIR